jgi:hypothetical protein
MDTVSKVTKVIPQVKGKGKKISEKNVKIDETKQRLKKSRLVIFPQIIFYKEFREQMEKQWTPEVLSKTIVNTHQDDNELPTLPVPVVMKAGSILAKFLSTQSIPKPSILEIMAGNCSGSRILHGMLVRNGLEPKVWVSTDIIDYKKSVKDIKYDTMDGLQSIKKYGESSDVLLLMCPPPNEIFYDPTHVNPMALCDFYSIIDYIEICLKRESRQFIVFIGELGGSDGTEGLYTFMLNYKRITLRHREMLIEAENYWGIIEKEIFIFEINK